MIFSRLFSALSLYSKNMSCHFKFSEYDVIGFDLDNTLLQYNLSNIFPLQYTYLSKYLITNKGYHKENFPSHMTDDDVDFFQRGLFMDLNRGNVLYLRDDGFILKATHGTTPIEDGMICHIYGPSRNWKVTNQFMTDPLSLWDSCDARTFLDFTDSIAVLIFAKAIDSVDSKMKPTEYNVWVDVLEALVAMYQPDSSYTKTTLLNLSEYFYPCDKSVIEWIRKLKSHAKVILITGAEENVASITLPYCLGNNYPNIFDFVVMNAKKPGFFTMSRPFETLENKPVDNIVWGGQYKRGNWPQLYELMKSNFGREIKCLYIGDNPIQDVYAPTIIEKKLDTVAMLEELVVEKGYTVLDYKHSKYVASRYWGPYLSSPDFLTITGGIIKTHAKLAIPSLQLAADKPIEFDFNEENIKKSTCF